MRGRLRPDPGVRRLPGRRRRVGRRVTPEMVDGERRMASDLSRVLRGAPVAVHFGKGLPGTLRAGRLRADGPGAAHGRHVPGGTYRTAGFCAPGRPSDGTDPHRDGRRGKASVS